MENSRRVRIKSSYSMGIFLLRTTSISEDNEVITITITITIAVKHQILTKEVVMINIINSIFTKNFNFNININPNFTIDLAILALDMGFGATGELSMDWTPIITAIITGLFAVIGQYIISRKKTREDEIKDAVREQKQSDRLDAIERKLDIHNGYAEKFGEISRSMTAIQKDIEYMKKD